MKKILFLMFAAIIAIAGCNDSDDPIKTTADSSDITLSPDSIYKWTGCTPTNIELIRKIKLFIDNAGNKYLYGSKLKGSVESFWIAKYDNKGNQQWEIINRDESCISYAYMPTNLNESCYCKFK